MAIRADQITTAVWARLFHADNDRYVDLVCSWGPMILGHGDYRRHPASPAPSRPT